jgi:hypothetical protein
MEEEGVGSMVTAFLKQFGVLKLIFSSPHIQSQNISKMPKDFKESISACSQVAFPLEKHIIQSEK